MAGFWADIGRFSVYLGFLTVCFGIFLRIFRKFRSDIPFFVGIRCEMMGFEWFFGGFSGVYGGFSGGFVGLVHHFGTVLWRERSGCRKLVYGWPMGIVWGVGYVSGNKVRLWDIPLAGNGFAVSVAGVLRGVFRVRGSGVFGEQKGQDGFRYDAGVVFRRG